MGRQFYSEWKGWRWICSANIFKSDRVTEVQVSLWAHSYVSTSGPFFTSKLEPMFPHSKGWGLGLILRKALEMWEHKAVGM